eukprot:TRINITY_DN6811_c0_g1_i1.p1 TRINITY_DN6811_c0_g1~~TRINITY_DN6811_c0_g1_i1.p1  ORF type:complete len:279 (-),score=120.00 TRINITY_DN6811_c0_g1_i1:156-992(-)
MRGNKYARKFDVTKTRKERKHEKKRALSRTNRVKRLKRKLGAMKEHKEVKQKGSHTSALMESYVLRRKKERQIEKEKLEAEKAMYANGGVPVVKKIETGEERRARLLQEKQDAIDRKKEIAAGKKRAREEPSESESDYEMSGSDDSDSDDSSSVDSEFASDDDDSDGSDSDGSSLDFSALKGVVDSDGAANLPGLMAKKTADLFSKKKPEAVVAATKKAAAPVAKKVIASSSKDTAPPAKKKVAAAPPATTAGKKAAQAKEALQRQKSTPKAGTRSLY